VIVIGLDGLDPRLVGDLLQRRALPNLARLRTEGGFAAVRTTLPAQTPVAWSTFATGRNPGAHGIYDFIHRDPRTYLPDLSLTRFEQKNVFLPPRAVNLRQGKPLWQELSDAGISSVVLRCPCTFPPDRVRGRVLSGMGVPDLRGSLGTPTFYTTRPDARAGESEVLISIEVRQGTVRTHLPGPRTGRGDAFVSVPFVLHLHPDSRVAVLRSDGDPSELRLQENAWSDWLRLRFKLGALRSVPGVVRFFLRSACPEVELYASPINFDPGADLPYPISAPDTYAQELVAAVGTFHSAGMPEDHTGLNNGRLSEEAFLAQCAHIMSERQRMMEFELGRLDEGFFFVLFDTPDRIQHMFWRFREPNHPAYAQPRPGLEHVIEDCYRVCDAIVGRAFEYVDDRTLLIVVSDHGFSSFRRGLHLNAWLRQQGFLTLRPDADPHSSFLEAVDWSRTRAYAVGLGAIYLNRADREAHGIVHPQESESLERRIAQALATLRDPQSGEPAVRRVVRSADAYHGAATESAPDLVVCFTPGYRASWATALGGGFAEPLLEDNRKAWSGDHVVDPECVPGTLLMNRPFHRERASLVDLAPTVLNAFGLGKGPELEGESLLI
jgi:predicted AlkP superfamily phosphohydrolase/phosphomutase